MNWKTFKETVEKTLKAQNCENPDLAEVEGIDFKSYTLASGIHFNTTTIESVSYYKEGDSFYIVG